MTSLPLGGTNSATRAARSLAPEPVSIGGVEPMPVYAVSPASIEGTWPEAAMGVNETGDRFEVAGPDAVVHTAPMVDLQAVRDRAERQFVGKTMGTDANAIDRELTVAVFVCGGRPQPAVAEMRRVGGHGAVLVDLGPEAFSGASYGDVVVTGAGSYELPRPSILLHADVSSFGGAQMAGAAQ